MDIREEILDTMRARVLTLDGSMGVMLQRLHLTEEGFRSGRFKTHSALLRGNYDALCLSRPGLVADVHREYLNAGADIIETNTFNANRLSQEAYGLATLTEEINRAGAEIARREADAFMANNPTTRIYVAGAIGPTAVSVSLAADIHHPAAPPIDFYDLSDAYTEQARGLVAGGVDFFLIETAYDLLNIKAAIHGITAASDSAGRDIPFIVSLSVSDRTDRLLSGHSLEDVVAEIAPFRPLAIGLNCLPWSDKIDEPLRFLAKVSPFPIIFYPNAGLPDQLGNYALTPAQFTDNITPLLAEGLLNIVGGCCGTSPMHIRALHSEVQKYKPRKILANQ